MQQLRRDPLHGHWAIIADARGSRPKDLVATETESTDEVCPFCPGNEAHTPEEVDAIRPTPSDPNQPGWTVRIIPNKYPALSLDGASNGHVVREVGELHRCQPGLGVHEVVISTTQHHMRPADFSVDHWDTLLAACQYRMESLMRDPRIKHVLLFENSGAAAGASRNHPHMQLIGTPMTPAVISSEMLNCRAYSARHETCLLCDLVARELEMEERIVYQDDATVTFVPYAPRVPYEMITVPRAHRYAFTQVPQLDRRRLADHVRRMLRALVGAVGRVPYNWVLHSAPQTTSDPTVYHWHIELLPRLVSFAGFELGAGAYINSIAPEAAAAALREAVEA